MTFYLLSRIALSLFMTINIDDITLVLIFIQGKDMKLTIKQEKFCNYYLESGNASEAYRRAYSFENMRPETINIRACELLANGKIAVRVKEMQADLQRRSDITKDEAIDILKNIARANVVDMLQIKRGKNYVIFLIKDLSKLPLSFQLAIQSVKSTDKGFEVKMYSKIDALDRLSKMMGWDAPVKSEVNIDGEDKSITIQVIDKREDVINGDTDD